ncbi:PREDICTED: tetratricopeptide repeat protein 1 [Dufourea novaeangliae]|uniref:Tetratricopeptide repeat protein 1 n=1 Tax=Dufourea novaeangliae TaxID=178035 RepID=A0A154PN89_DUFNO|nr:PREDICTED: tetratricopeptide repeat protein 1 [Dufourea novaeangliae]XP_015435131.1 PREDICTED: tetratricopeptide repeat protein 1 [Dufourea novaeangliae]KZC12690.1 Tetratricopeptide repeat protein 1 [Dufourea novaeangliae]
MDSTSELDLKSNEEIIEELTKDLESSCIRADENSVSGKDSSKLNARNDSLPKETCERVETHIQDSQEPPDPPRDFVDEELLKDREIGLSENEKETLRHEAEMLKNNGNDLFKSGEYIEAISMYTRGIQTCPLAYSKERSILYANRAAAKLKCLEKESAILDCTKAIELNPGYVKALVRRGQLYEEVEKLDEALEDFKKVYSLDPTHTEAYHEVCRLPRLIEERNEKLKTEMLGKLKDLGNMVLKPFGLSTNNFELQKDPNSGGYSVKFHQNPS